MNQFYQEEKKQDDGAKLIAGVIVLSALFFLDSLIFMGVWNMLLPAIVGSSKAFSINYGQAILIKILMLCSGLSFVVLSALYGKR